MASSSPSRMNRRSSLESLSSLSDYSDSDTSLTDVKQKKWFACAQCDTRHLFYDLSPKDMFCEDCLATKRSHQCSYCRRELLQHFELIATVCGQCQQNELEFGKPITCECCNLIAAFGRSQCDRCVKKSAKYGEPMPCSKCKLVAAFK